MWRHEKPYGSFSQKAHPAQRDFETFLIMVFDALRHQKVSRSVDIDFLSHWSWETTGNRTGPYFLENYVESCGLGLLEFNREFNVRAETMIYDAERLLRRLKGDVVVSGASVEPLRAWLQAEHVTELHSPLNASSVYTKISGNMASDYYEVELHELGYSFPCLGRDEMTCDVNFLLEEPDVRRPIHEGWAVSELPESWANLCEDPWEDQDKGLPCVDKWNRAFEIYEACSSKAKKPGPKLLAVTLCGVHHSDVSVALAALDVCTDTLPSNLLQQYATRIGRRALEMCEVRWSRSVAYSQACVTRTDNRVFSRQAAASSVCGTSPEWLTARLKLSKCEADLEILVTPKFRSILPKCNPV